MESCSGRGPIHMTLDTIPRPDSKGRGARHAMTAQPPERPHFRHPPILEQAISLSFERITTFDLVDFGLFWDTVRKQFPSNATGARFNAPIESFEEIAMPISFSLVGPVELPRCLLRNDQGELIQLQDDSFGFNCI